MSLSVSRLRKPVAIALVASICVALVLSMGIGITSPAPDATITLSPNSGYGNTIVTVSGSGFTKSVTVGVYFAGMPVLSTWTGSDGSFSGKFIVPTDQDGEYVVSAVDRRGIKASTVFKVVVNPVLMDLEDKLDELLGRLTGEILIGALLPLTGDLATFGENEKAAIELAVAEVNELLFEAGAPWTLKVLFRDTQIKPDVALTQLQGLFNNYGVQFVIGPLSSAEVRAIKDYANANEILVVSHGSTAPDLAIPDDFIFRFCGQDVAQRRAIARLMYDDGKRYVIPVWRDDFWGNGLVNMTKTRFEELGGTFLEGIKYAPDETDFSDEAMTLNDTVASAVGTYGADQVAVLHISFEEVNAFMTACLAYPVLDDVEWYGSEGTCGSRAMLEDPIVRDFAMAVNYTCTMFSPTMSDKYAKVHDALVAQLEREPDIYAYVAYDIVWALTYSLSIVNRYDSAAVKAVLPEVTESLFGASGWIVLNEAGDRARGDYDLWIIAEVDIGVYDWKHVGTWLYDTDSIIWLP